MTGLFKEYKDLIETRKYNRIIKKSKQLNKIKVLNINSTKLGGGVAEILHSVIPLYNDLGLEVDWDVIEGDSEFFDTTKKMHNTLQGADSKFTKKELNHHKKINYNQYEKFNFDKYDIVIIHDPQPLPLIKYKNKNTKWIWRCHIDLSETNKEIFNYLKKNFIDKFDRVVFTNKKYINDIDLSKCTFIPPVIDPFSEKNVLLNFEEFEEKYDDIFKSNFIITQISRFDHWKNTLGVIQSFNLLKKEIPNVKLVLMGNMASDDPEGEVIFNEILEYCEENDLMKDIVLITENNPKLVNFFQRYSHIVMQYSIKEGFALTVSEAMYKETAVIGSNVGGIPMQIKNDKNGFLANPFDYEDCKEKMKTLLCDNKKRYEFGRKAKEKVIKDHIMPNIIEDYIDLFTFLQN